MQIHHQVLGLASAILFVTPFAHAESVYWLQGSGGLKTEHLFEFDDGLSITASAKSYDPWDDQFRQAYVGRYSNGLGVTNSVYHYQNPYHFQTTDGSHTVDGRGFDDRLILDFNLDTHITGISFGYIYDPDEEVTLYGDDNQYLGQFNLGKQANHHGYVTLDLEDLNYSGQKLALAATHKDSGWKVKSLHVTAVPSPAAFGAGLVGLTMLTMSRRRRAS